MAKEDFCFTYYDGDAARDVAHMTRLCRGAYHDLVIMQRKVGPMTLQQLKMVLSSDFEVCWPSLEIVLKQNNEQKFYIEWVERSVEKSRENSKIQAEKIKQYWQDVKDGKIQRYKKNGTTVQNNDDLVIPLGDGYGNIDRDDLKRGEGEKLLVPEMFRVFKELVPGYPGDQGKDFQPLFSIAEFISGQINTGPPIKNIKKISVEWKKICAYVASDDFYRSKTLLTISNHIQELYQKINSNAINKQRAGKTKHNRTGSGAYAGGF